LNNRFEFILKRISKIEQPMVIPSPATLRGGKKRVLVGKPLNEQNCFKQRTEIVSGEIDNHDGC
jgi:hypothetical protein